MKIVLCLLVLVAGESYVFAAPPLAELQLMTESELVSEARAACQTSATKFKVAAENKRPMYEGFDQAPNDYLHTIGGVARQKNNGTTPQWAVDMGTAAFGKDPDACSAVAARAEEEIKKRPQPVTPAAKKGKKTKERVRSR